MAFDIDQMTPEQMRAALRRVLNLCQDAHDPYEAPSDGSFVHAHTTGGYNRADVERVWERRDEPGKDYEGGDWYPVNDPKAHAHSWSAVNAFDEPPCDRPSVSLEVLVPVSAISQALLESADLPANWPPLDGDVWTDRDDVRWVAQTFEVNDEVRCSLQQIDGNTSATPDRVLEIAAPLMLTAKGWERCSNERAAEAAA